MWKSAWRRESLRHALFMDGLGVRRAEDRHPPMLDVPRHLLPVIRVGPDQQFRRAER